MDRVFLDANVLFSTAYRADAGTARLWSLADVALITSAYAAEEARRNLESSEQLARLDKLLAELELVGATSGRPLPEGIVLPEKDRPILLTAIEAAATHLVTGDFTHFGRYYGKRIAGVLVTTPGEYLRARKS